MLCQTFFPILSITLRGLGILMEWNGCITVWMECAFSPQGRREHSLGSRDFHPETTMSSRARVTPVGWYRRRETKRNLFASARRTGVSYNSKDTLLQLGQEVQTEGARIINLSSSALRVYNKLSDIKPCAEFFDSSWIPWFWKKAALIPSLEKAAW